MERSLRYAILVWVTAAIALATSAQAATVVAAPLRVSPAAAALDTNGRDEVAPAQTEREMRRELRRLERDIRREERLAGRGAGGPRRAMAIASLVLGIVAIPMYFVPLPFVGLAGIAAAILALVFGAIAKRRARRRPEEYGGLRQAKAGFILGIIGTGIIVVLLGIVFALLLSGV